MLIFCDFIQVYVFTTNHHLKVYDYTSIFPPCFQREKFFVTSCLLEDEVFPKRDLLLKEKVCS